MIQHTWSVLSRESKIDADTNMLSIVDIYEEIGIDVGAKEDVPAGQVIPTPVPSEVTSSFFRDDKSKEESFNLRVTLLDPAQKEIAKMEMVIVFEAGKSRMRTRIKSPNLGVTTSGLYTFRVAMQVKNNDFKEVAILPLDVKLSVRKV